MIRRQSKVERIYVRVLVGVLNKLHARLVVCVDPGVYRTSSLDRLYYSQSRMLSEVRNVGGRFLRPRCCKQGTMAQIIGNPGGCGKVE